ncbi:MFS transporter [Paenibacillus sp. N3.4]|uniref:MFS transporter n=1 Tax=Paenibacillus sp. N3.4 TaxID=2603222 RepID=UPI00164F5F30|nr:MFS transporter [Paenibacillus sp. N3.4]
MSIKHMSADKRATAMGFFQAIYGLGMFVGPVLMGFISDWFSLNQGFIVLGILGILSAALSQWFVQNHLSKPIKGGNSSVSL